MVRVYVDVLTVCDSMLFVLSTEIDLMNMLM